MNCAAMKKVIVLFAGIALFAGSASGYEYTAEQQQKLREFLKKYPQADENRDGVLTPSEIWLLRSRASKAKGVNSEEMKDINTVMRAISMPAPIDESRTYGPAPGKKIKLFILSGQSNMAGQGLSAELPESMLEPNDRLLMCENGKWQPLRPLRPTFGPEIATATRGTSGRS